MNKWSLSKIPILMVVIEGEDINNFTCSEFLVRHAHSSGCLACIIHQIIPRMIETRMNLLMSPVRRGCHALHDIPSPHLPRAAYP